MVFNVLFMTILPAGKVVANSSFGKVYQDSRGVFFPVFHSLLEVIEARATNGRGYIEINPESIFDIPYAENPKQDTIIPETFCFRRMDHSKFPSWREDLEEGHPDYSSLYHEVISLD